MVIYRQVKNNQISNKEGGLCLITIRHKIRMIKTLKKIVGIAVVGVMACVSTSIFASEPLQINIFGEVIESPVAPFVDNERTLVPVRVVSEGLGFKVDWDAPTRTFTVEGVDVAEGCPVTIVGTINEPTVTITKNGVSVKKNIDENPNVTAKLVNGSTFLPLRFVADNYGLKTTFVKPIIFIQMPGDEDPTKPNDTVWNGNIKDFVNAIVDKTDMELSKGGNQAISNNGNIIASPPLGSKKCDVEITSRGWLFDADFTPASIKKEKQAQMNNVKTIIEMYTSDKSAYSKANATLQAGKARDEKNPIVLSDGTKLTVTGENGLIKFRLYGK